MSTQKTNFAAARIAQLLAQDEKLFHLKDLAVLWNISSYNTLRTTVKRYCSSKLLHRIYKGFYSVILPEKIDPVLLGAKALHGYCYLSIESILFLEGYISRKINYLTFVSDTSKKIFIGKHRYMSRQLKPEFLYNPAGIEIKNGVKRANAYRAIADMLYFSPKYHFDRPIPWSKVMSMQKKIGYSLTPHRYVTS